MRRVVDQDRLTGDSALGVLLGLFGIGVMLWSAVAAIAFGWAEMWPAFWISVAIFYLNGRFVLGLFPVKNLPDDF